MESSNYCRGSNLILSILESLTAARIFAVVAFVFIPGTSNGDTGLPFFDFKENIVPSLRRISTSSFCALIAMIISV